MERATTPYERKNSEELTCPHQIYARSIRADRPPEQIKSPCTQRRCRASNREVSDSQSGAASKKPPPEPGKRHTPRQHRAGKRPGSRRARPHAGSRVFCRDDPPPRTSLSPAVLLVDAVRHADIPLSTTAPHPRYLPGALQALYHVHVPHPRDRCLAAGRRGPGEDDGPADVPGPMRAGRSARPRSPHRTARSRGR